MKLSKKYTLLMLAGTLSAQFLAGCGQQPATDVAVKDTASSKKAPCCDLSDAKDGSYTGESSSDDSMGKGRIAISIKDHKIVSVNYVGVDSEGKLKGADYGKTNGKVENPAFYQKAQTAVKANTAYAEQLLQVQELAKVDAISGATISYQQFIEAAKMALLEAKK